MANINDVWQLCIADISTLEAMLEKDDNNLPKINDLKANIRNNFTEIIKFIESHMVLWQDKFYGAVLLNLSVVNSFDINGAIDVKLDKYPIKLELNPMFLRNYTLQQIEAIIANDILALAFDLPTKFSDLNPTADQLTHNLLLKAKEASCNDMVKHDILIRAANGGRQNMKIPEDAYCCEDVRLDAKKNVKSHESLEYYLSALKRKPQDISANGRNQGIGSAFPQSDSNFNNDNFPAMPKNNKTSQSVHNWENNSKKEEQRSKIQALIKEAYESLNEKDRGTIPLELQSAIDRLLQPAQIKWQEIFKRIVGTLPSDYRTDIRLPHRRQPDRLNMHGRRRNKIIRLVLALDTSGSISDVVMSYFLNEVAILAAMKNLDILVIECDAEIQKIYKVKSLKDINYHVQGRGGTSFTPVIEYVNENDFKDALLVYFTDGEGEVSIPEPRVHKMLWILPENSCNLSTVPVYGKILTLDTDAKYRMIKEGNKL